MGCSSSSNPPPTGAGGYPKQQQQTPAANSHNTSPHNTTSNSAPQNGTHQDNAPQQQAKQVKLEKKTIEKYIELENQIHTFEDKNILKTYEMKKAHCDDLKDTVKQLDAYHKECMERTAKEKKDVDDMNSESVKDFFKKENRNYDEQFTKEQEEYLEALNKQEIAKKELDGVKQQVGDVEKEVKALEGDATKVKKIYEEQDKLLAEIFGGNYGSDLENKLEMEFDNLTDRKQRIGVAKTKWTNARVYLQTACKQLSFVVGRWETVKETKDMQEKYAMATECRNNLVAGAQNLNNAQKLLASIAFPYCKQDEITTLTRATNNIYTDMQTEDRHKHAGNCYQVTNRRAAALLQWFDNVIENTIKKDWSKACDDNSKKEKELRAERLRLLMEKYKASGGKDDPKLKTDLPPPAPQEEPEPSGKAMEADRVSVTLPPADDQGKKDGEAPLPLNELAPPPNDQDLFGDIAKVKQQHEQDMAELNKSMEVNKARMDQGLQEKLAARRSRRERLEAQQ